MLCDASSEAGMQGILTWIAATLTAACVHHHEVLDVMPLDEIGDGKYTLRHGPQIPMWKSKRSLLRRGGKAEDDFAKRD
jgi:hypothetical protein